MMAAPRSLQGRLLALVLGLVAGVWLISAVLTWIDVRHELDELLDSHLAQAAALLVVRQTHPFDDDDQAADAPALHRYAPRVAFQVFDEGRLVLRSANAPSAPMIAAGSEAAPQAAPPPTGFASVVIDGVRWRVFTTRGGKHDVQVYVGEQIDARAAILMAVLRSVLWPTLLALPLLALGIWWAVHQGVAPLRRLGQALAGRQPSALHAVVLPGAPSEMAPMLDALNGLFARIAELMESERRFTADAAHELRTPIAAIRAQAQVALGETDDARRRHALRATVDGCDRANRLVGQLLTLSRLESGAAPALQALDLSALARSVVADLAPGVIAKGQTIAVDVDEANDACAVRGDATLLGVLARNLVDNASRYSPAGAAIRVTVARRPDAVELRVEDDGPGMCDADLQRLGERFFRVIGNDATGSGLGWSIVRRIAAVHQADIRPGRAHGSGGLVVVVTFPAA